MKSYSKFQNYLSLLMFITINILFYFKYLSKISIACGAITSVLYILFIIFLFKYKPTFGRKLVNYNPQNEMFQRFKTKCSFLQNEAYLCKSFFLP